MRIEASAPVVALPHPALVLEMLRVGTQQHRLRKVALLQVRVDHVNQSACKSILME
jgi:hypothetical protein